MSDPVRKTRCGSVLLGPRRLALSISRIVCVEMVFLVAVAAVQLVKH